MKLVRYSTHHALSACRGDPTVEEVYASFTRMNIASANDEPQKQLDASRARA